MKLPCYLSPFIVEIKNSMLYNVYVTNILYIILFFFIFTNNIIYTINDFLYDTSYQ
jgi:uncharacterized integral membrane protein